MENLYDNIQNCRLSGKSLVTAETIVSFNSLPIPGLFFETQNEAKSKNVPMTLVASEEGLIQLKETVNGDLYRYYKSRRADNNHISWLANISDQMNEKFEKENKILEVGGGEGLLLKYLYQKDFKDLYNVDPSHENEERPYYNAIVGLFPEALSSQLYRNSFSCIIGQHFLEHVPDPLAVMRDAFDLLTDDGELWIEVPDMESSALDSYFQIGIIYPLHLSYFTKKSLKKLGENAGFFLDTIEVIDHYGKSLWAKFTKTPNDKTFLDFEDDIRIKPTILKYFEELKHFAADTPKKILCWGAAERAHTTYAILSGYGVEATAIFDSNSEIKGMYIAGIDTPILGPESFPENPDHLLILSPPNHKSIIEGVKDKLSKETLIHIPLIGHFTFEEYEAEFPD